jgi:hypothetical protein
MLLTGRRTAAVSTSMSWGIRAATVPERQEDRAGHAQVSACKEAKALCLALLPQERVLDGRREMRDVFESENLIAPSQHPENMCVHTSKRDVE